MLRQITAVLNDDQGQGLAEYGLILGLVTILSTAASAYPKSRCRASSIWQA